MEWIGTFEVPESGVRVGGRLTIDPGKSTLTTFGVLASSDGEPMAADAWPQDNVDSVPVVWGVSEEGQRLTLLNLTSLGASRQFRGDWTFKHEWICDAAVGGHLVPEESVGFSAISFGLSDLSAWLGTPRPKESHLFTPPGYKLEVERHDLAKLTHNDIAINIDGAFSQSSGFDTRSVSFPARITADVGDDRLWQALVNEIVTPIEVLLWVATGQFSALDDLKVRVDGEHPRYEPLWVSMLQPSDFQPPENRLPGFRMLFLAEEMPGGLAAGLSRWMTAWGKLRPAFGPVIARVRAPFAYANDRFHSSVAGLESFSVLKHGELEIPKEERDRRIEVVREGVDEREPEIKDWVVEGLLQAHRLSLRSRLERLLVEAGPIGEAITDSEDVEFTKDVVKARNAYAHSMAEVEGSVRGGAVLAWTAVALGWLLRYHAMVEIGFDPEDARTRVLENNHFEQVVERLHEAIADLG